MSDRWGRVEARPRPIVAALVLVGITAVVALAARGTMWDRVGVTTVWLALGIIAALSFLHRLRSAHLGRVVERKNDVPVVIRHDSTEVQNDARRHRRFVPARRATTLHLRDGRQVAARIIDISVAGVAIEARLNDADFMAVDRVGARPAGPVRRTPVGAVFGFDTLLDPQPFDASFVL